MPLRRPPCTLKHPLPTQHLEQLWLSYNNISSLNGLDKMKNLKILYVGNNKISDIKVCTLLLSVPASHPS